MKHFFNFFIVLVLVGLAIAVAYMLTNSKTNTWGIAYVPITIFMFLWGYKLYKDY